MRVCELRVADDVGRTLVRRRNLRADAVDHVVDRAGAVQCDGEQIMHLHACGVGHLERVRCVQRRVHVGVDVAAQTPRLVRRDRIGHLVRRVAEDPIVLPGGLVRRVVRHLVLEEDRLAVLAVPEHVVLLEVLDEQTGRGHIVAVDDETGVGGVDSPPDTLAVVGAPGPDVVQDDVVAVDLERDGRLAGVRSADAEEDVLDAGRVGRIRPVVVLTGLAIPGVLRADLDKRGGVDTAGVDHEAGDVDAGSVNSPALVQIGTQHAGNGQARQHNNWSDASDPTGIQDVFFRIGGPPAGKATVAPQVNSDNVILDDIWAWRADHGQGVGWTVNTADTGLVVNGDNVTATGLFVEHFQKYNVLWNGENGKTVFFQNEMPYDAPNQAAWQHDGVFGYAAYKVADSVTTHEAWGLGSYIYTNVDPS